MKYFFKWFCFYLSFIWLISVNELSAQNVGIGETDFTPDPSSILELKSLTKGFLMPRMTKAERLAIVNPAHGLMVVQTDDDPPLNPAGIWYYCNIPTVCNEWRNIVSMSGSVSFNNILSGTNTQATMEVGTGASLSTTGSGTIQANIFANTNSVSASVDLQTDEVAGILPVSKGGTGTSSAPASNSIIIGNPAGDGYTSTVGTEGQVLSYDNLGNPVWISAGTGTVSSVGIDLPATVFANGPDVTTTGDLTATFINQTANTFFAGPTTAPDATPTFRALVTDDIPDLDASIITTGTFNTARIPSLDASIITSGTFDASRIPDIDASKITTGTLSTTVGGTGASAITGMVRGNGAAPMTGITDNQYNITYWADNEYIGGDDKLRWNDATSTLSVTGTIDNNTTTNGFIAPRLDATQISNIPTPTEGTILYNTTTNTYQFFNGTAWVDVGTGMTAGGDLSGAYPDPTVVGLQGRDVSSTAPTAGQVLSWNNLSSQWEPTSPTSGGTVTSVDLSMPSNIFDVTGNPITTSGTFGVTLDNQTANTVFAGPSSGGAATPSFRALVADDIPNLDASKITTGSFDASRIPNLDASKITTGTLDAARIPNLDASKITTGTFDAARIPNLDASKITTGTLSTSVGGTGTSVAPTANGVIISNAAGNGYTSTAAGTTGQILIGNTGGAPSWSNLNSVAWGLTGNPSTNPATNFVGTTDLADLVFRTNNTEYLRIKGNGTNNGFLGIGTNNPITKLDLFNGDFSLTNNDNLARSAFFYERSGHGGSNYSSFRADTQFANINYVLPPTQRVSDYSRAAGIGILANTPNADSITGNLSWIDAQSFGGSFVNVYVTATNQNYGATVDDFLIVISTKDRTVTLPKASDYPGKVYYIVIGTTLTGNSDVGYVAATGTDKIAHRQLTSTVTLSWGNSLSDSSGILVVSDGFGVWYIIATRRFNQ